MYIKRFQYFWLPFVYGDSPASGYSVVPAWNEAEFCTCQQINRNVCVCVCVRVPLLFLHFRTFLFILSKRTKENGVRF